MDDYSTNVLSESKNEWSIVLMNNIVPHIIDGIRSVFNESINLCNENGEESKYLMTFQNLLSRIPKWNPSMIETEKERIIKLSNCSYLEDVLLCVHIIQLKVLSAVRVGSESKKINIDIPDLGTFIHQVYINVARKLYSNIYLFQIDVENLQVQKYNREFELLVQTCIMNTIRDRMPIEKLLRQYIDETQEIEVTKVERVVDTIIKEPNPSKIEPNTQPNNVNNVNANVNMNNVNNEIFVEETLPTNFVNVNMNNMNAEPFEIKERIFDIPEPKVAFSDKNSVLEFDSPNEDSISLGEPISNLDFEDLDLSKNENDKVELTFEEL